MKKAMKSISKILAVFLSLIFIVEILPTQVMAEAYNEYNNEKQYFSDLLDNPAEKAEEEKAEILYEVTEKRDEHTKVYKRADGTYTALVSQTPLHFMNDGVWKEIDNTLVSKNGALTTADNPFNVTLPERITSNSQITLENNGNEIAFSVNDISAANSKITDKKADKTEEFEAAVANIKSEVKYENVAEDTDIEYVVLPNGIKENIIVSDAASIKDTYSFDIEIGNLTYRLNDNNSLDITDTNGDVKFTIPAPVMTDSNLALSYDIGVNVSNNNNGTITLVYSPSREWTGTPERAYPITIDPAIMIQDNSENWVEDTVVSSSLQDANASNQTGYDVPFAAVSNTNDYKSEIYTKIDVDKFSWIDENVTLTKVLYLSAGEASGGSILLKEITQQFSAQTVTYNTKPTLSNTVSDYYVSPYGVGESQNDISIFSFDITKLFVGWLNGGVNNGFAFVTEDEDLSANIILNGSYNLMNQEETTNTYIFFDFVYSSGYDDRFDYHTQQLGRAGNAYINDFTRQLYIKRDDISISGNIMPVTVSFLYNSSVKELFKYQQAINENYIMPLGVYGNNWATNYNRVIYYNHFADYDNLQTLCYITENGNTISFTKSTELDSENNEVTVFTEEKPDGLNSSGYSAFITDVPEGYEGDGLEYIKITRPDGNTESFDSHGRLVSVTKKVAVNNTTAYQTITVLYCSDLTTDNNFLAIEKITDGVGRQFRFEYDNITGLLSSIKCYESNNTQILSADNTNYLMTEYLYSANRNVENVVFNSYNAAGYTYYDNSNLKEIFACSVGNNGYPAVGYKVEYIYNGQNNSVYQIVESATGVFGNTVTITQQGPYQVKFEDLTGYSIIEQFDNYGKLRYYIDSKGNYSDSGKVSPNLLPNSSFENGLSSWQLNNISTADLSNDAESNCYSLNIASQTASNKSVSQTVAVQDEDVYTFSAFIKAQSIETEDILTLNIKAVNSENEIVVSNSRKIAAVCTDYKKYSVQLPYTADEFSTVTVEVGIENGKGNFFVDSLQLESGAGAGSYDYLTNGSFNASGNSLASWTANGAISMGSDTVLGEESNTVILSNGSSVTVSKSLSQTVRINGKKDDVITFGCWAKGSTAYPESESLLYGLIQEESLASPEKIAGIKLQYTYTDENEQQQNDSVEKSIVGNITDWQYLSESIVLKGDSDEITVSLIYENNPNEIVFANASLTKQELTDTVEETYEEENEPEPEITEPVEQTENTPEQTETYCVCGENCAYGVGCPCTCSSEAECNCSECKKLFDIQFDDFGNIISIIINGFQFSSLISMFNQRTYTSNGNYLTKTTNENDKDTHYLYDQANGYLQSETDANGGEKTYSYFADGSIQRINTQYGTLLGIGGTTILKKFMSTEYEYNSIGNVTKIKHNNFRYRIAYNSIGKVTALYVEGLVGAQSKNLVTYQYNNSTPRNELKKVIFNNSSSSTYEYDNNGNVISITNAKTGSAALTETYNYYYDSLGQKVYEEAYTNNIKSRAIYYNGDSVEVYSDNGLEYYASYDDEGNFYEIVNGTTYTKYQNDGVVNEETGDTNYLEKVSNSDITVSMSKRNDTFGRTKQKSVFSTDIPGNNTNTNFSAVITDYTYKTYTKDGEEKASSRVDTYENKAYYGTSVMQSTLNSSVKYAYGYDDNGNITREYSVDSSNNRTLRYRYTYDEANQLTRLDDNVNNKTYVYNYDFGGNMISLNEYNYTLNDNLGTVRKTISCSYDLGTSGNWRWADRLISYDGKSISYDNAGNPSSYNGNALTWNGKQLRTFKLKTNDYLQFEYNADGLRTNEKYYSSANELEYSLDYIWSDEKITAQTLMYPVITTVGEEQQTVWHRVNSKIVYAEGENSPSAVMLDDKEYLFIRNMFGDIISVIDADTGNTLVSYSYDPWGNITPDYDSGLSQTELLILKTFCGFAYRGYKYDFISGLYYLQSRYYNPQWRRFINADDTSILLASVGQIKGANLFIYCGNNPVNMVDYSGFKSTASDFLSFKGIITLIAFLDYYNCIIADSDANSLDKKYKNDKKGFIRIKLDETKNGIKGSLTFSDVIFTMYLEFGNFVFDVLALISTFKFKDEFYKKHNAAYFDDPTNEREFLFSDDCVSREIKEHCLLKWNQEKLTSKTSIILSLGLTLRTAKKYITDSELNLNTTPFLQLWRTSAKNSCSAIDIYEQDADKWEDSRAFDYYNGIRGCYFCTWADPYYFPNAHKRDFVVRADWKTRKIPC
ncbi:MAG: RHS repeat-associated core domain-containing protein [Clostridia bacterium]|nr:RHS repeat-associated core domain-containing protein [Clostridia bacterium]